MSFLDIAELVFIAGVVVAGVGGIIIVLRNEKNEKRG